MLVYRIDGDAISSIRNIYGASTNTAYNIYGEVVYIGSVYLSIGTVGCGSICAIDDGKLLSIGDGDTNDTVVYDDFSAKMSELSEVAYV